MQLNLQNLSLYEGGYLLLKRALRQVGPGGAVAVVGVSTGLDVELRVWCRTEGHAIEWQEPRSGGTQAVVINGGHESSRWRNSQRAIGEDVTLEDSVAEHASPTWGLAGRGAWVEAGTPEFDFRLIDKVEVWSDDVGSLYRLAAAAQWDPETAIPWDASFVLPDDMEDAVVQVMTFLVENETAALMIPSRFIAQMHPHFREVMQALAVQAADEARHIEVFTRRARLRRTNLGLSTAAGQMSLKTLLDEPDFAVASFLLSVLGEGTFLSLLWFIERHAPDPITAAVARLAAQDEARHVAFGLAHLGNHLRQRPEFRARLASALWHRHDALQHTAGLNSEVFDALLLLGAGSLTHTALREGWQRLTQLTVEMDLGRRRRLVRLGFSDSEAEALSSLHTRNFM